MATGQTLPWAPRGAQGRKVTSTTVVPPPPPSPDTMIVGQALTLTSTYESIDVEFEYTGDSNDNATAVLEFKKTADPTWRTALALWRITYEGTSTVWAQRHNAKAFYGSVLKCTAGTSYDVRVTIADTDGVSGATVFSGTISTQVDSIPTAASLTPTRFVATNGVDVLTGGRGLTVGAPWLTLNYAIQNAPAGAIVQVAAGSYKNATIARTLGPITFLAASPAVDDTRAEINAGSHTIIEPLAVADPALDLWVDPGFVSTGLWGNPVGAALPVWKWAGSPVTAATQMGWADTRTGAMNRIPRWQPVTLNAPAISANTPQTWAELMHTNKTYNYGFFSSGTDLYVRIPDGVGGTIDPNTKWIFAGVTDGLKLNYRDCRVSGFEFRCMERGIDLQTTNAVDTIPDANRAADRAIVDHCLFTNCRYGVRQLAYNRDILVGLDTYGKNATIQYNRFLDSNMWTEGATAENTIPWLFIKQKIYTYDGVIYGGNRIGQECEGDALSGRGGGNQSVFRFNTIIGTFNGIAPGIQTDYDRYAGYGFDCHDNLLQHIADDALEPENQAINHRFWNNRIEESSTFMSVGPVIFGPVFVFRNEAWRTGNRGVGPVGAGHATIISPSEPRGVGCVMFKYSGSSRPAVGVTTARGRVYVIHNTFWTDQVSTLVTGNVGGMEQFAGGGNETECFYWRNNIIRVTRYIMETPATANTLLIFDEDYNQLLTTDATKGITFQGTTYDTIANYRAATGNANGDHSNAVNGNLTDATGALVDAELVDPTNGDLTLKVGSAFIDIGLLPVPNISDISGTNYLGAAPDLGYQEKA